MYDDNTEVESLDELLDQPDGVEEWYDYDGVVGWVPGEGGEPVPVPSDQVVPDAAPPRKRFRIVDDSGAAWAMRRAAQSLAEVVNVDDQADRQIEKVKAWRERARARHVSDMAYFDSLLRDWHAQRLAEEIDVDPRQGPVDEETWKKRAKTKTIPLPDGKIEARRGRGRFDVADEAAVLTFLGEHAPEAIDYKPRVTVAKFEEVETIVMGPDGRYRLRSPLDEVANDVGVHLAAALEEHGAIGSVARETFTTYGCTAAAVVAEEFPFARFVVEQEFGELPRVWALVTIPGVFKSGIGDVEFTVKPNVG